MNKFYWILAVIGTGLLVWFGCRMMGSRLMTNSDQAPTTASKSDPPPSIQNDPVKIFQRAFWASPTSEDKILHAERREWSGADGVQKWQWFMVIEPSAALLKRLCDDNAFGLVPAASASDIVAPPKWFTFEMNGVSILKSRQTKLQLIVSKNRQTLYATDSGFGFRGGVSQPITPTLPTPAPTPGRLPTTPPPLPKP